MPKPSRLSRPEILAEVRSFVARWFRDGREDGLDADTRLVTSGIVDSAGVLDVVEFLERRFGIDVADDDVALRNFDSLGALADFVRGKLGLP